MQIPAMREKDDSQVRSLNIFPIIIERFIYALNHLPLHTNNNSLNVIYYLPLSQSIFPIRMIIDTEKNPIRNI
jgi:hypothetical protein